MPRERSGAAVRKKLYEAKPSASFSLFLRLPIIPAGWQPSYFSARKMC